MEKEYFEYKKEYWKEELFRSSDKANFHSHNFCNTQANLASIVIGFLSFSIYFDVGVFSDTKILIFLTYMSAFLSLAFGLFNFGLKRRFWSDSTDKIQKINGEYLKFLKTKKDDTKQEDYRCLFEKEKLILGEKKVSSNSWAWISQSIFLAVSFLLFILVSWKAAF